MNSRISDRETANTNVKKVKHYISTTPVLDMPKNKNYGTLNQTKILIDILKLKKNSRYDPHIKQLIAECNAKLKSAANPLSHKYAPIDNSKRETSVSYRPESECPVEIQHEKIYELRQELNREEWFLNTGRQARR